MRSRSAVEPGPLGVVDLLGRPPEYEPLGHDVCLHAIRSIRVTPAVPDHPPDQNRRPTVAHHRDARRPCPDPDQPRRDRGGRRLRRRPGDRRRRQPQDRRRRRPGRGHGHVHLPDHLHAARRRAQGARPARGAHAGGHRRGRQPVHGPLPAVGGPGADATCPTRWARSSRRCSRRCGASRSRRSSPRWSASWSTPRCTTGSSAG